MRQLRLKYGDWQGLQHTDSIMALLCRENLYSPTYTGIACGLRSMLMVLQGCLSPQAYSRLCLACD